MVYAFGMSERQEANSGVETMTFQISQASIDEAKWHSEQRRLEQLQEQFNSNPEAVADKVAAILNDVKPAVRQKVLVHLYNVYSFDRL